MATSVAVNEAQQGDKFLAIAEQVQHGGTLQLNSRDLETMVRRIRDDGTKRILGGIKDAYLRQDRLEAQLAVLANDAADALRDMIKNMSARIDMRAANMLVLMGIVGNIALRCASGFLNDPMTKAYAKKALPFRLGRAFGEVFDLENEARLKLLAHFGEFMSAVDEAEADMREAKSTEWDGLYAAILFDQNHNALQLYLSKCSNLISEELCRFQDRLDERDYGAQL